MKVVWQGEVTGPAGVERIRAQSLHRHLPLDVRTLFPSGKSWQRALDAHQILKDHQPLTRATWVHPGDALVVLATDPRPPAPWPGGDWTYGFQDETLAVVWKPAGMPTSGRGGLNLAAQLPGHPVHRLDRDTSGWVVVSQDEALTIALHRAFASGQIEKTYWALASGACPHRFDVRLPLDGKPSHSTFQTLACGPWPVCERATLLKVTLHTGRTHQIRRHLHALRHGIVGDPIYQSPPARYTGSGLFLSALRLVFDHPLTGERIAASAPPPRKFRRIRWSPR